MHNITKFNVMYVFQKGKSKSYTYFSSPLLAVLGWEISGVLNTGRLLSQLRDDYQFLFLSPSRPFLNQGPQLSKYRQFTK